MTSFFPLARSFSVALVFTGLVLAQAGSARAEEALTPLDIARLRIATSIAISPDGRTIAYTLRVPRDPAKDPSGPAWSELHVIFPSGESRPFITGEVNVDSIDWTPDGRGISFLSKRGKDEHRSLYVIPVDGGEARKVLERETDISSYSWGPEGDRVAFIASEKVPEDEKSLREKGFDQEIYEEDYRSVRVHVARPEDEESEPRALELDGFPSELHWAPRGNLIALALAPTPLVDEFYMERRVRVVNADTGEIVARFENPGKLGEIAWSADGGHVAYLAGEDRHDPSAGRLMVAPASGGEPRQIPLDAEGDYADIAWKDAETITYLASVGVWTRIGEVSTKSGEHRVKVPEGKLVAEALSLSRDGRAAALLSDSPRHPREVFAMGSGIAEPRRLTDSNPWLEDMKFAEQEVVSYRARDGLELEGILVRPLDEEEGKRYPLILAVHGGPESHIKNGWVTYYSRPGQTAAARGFAVFYPNYRGSTGRGVEFSKLGQSDYAGKEFDDLVDAADHFISTGLADGKRVGITGGSYGGFASAWGATYYSDRFAASVMFVGISNQISKSGTTDIPNEMFLVHARKKLYGNWQWYLERSPIYHVEKAHTPILILHGKEDTRVHPSQSMELYRHLKNLDRAPVRLVFYPGEGHGNRKSASRLDYNLRMLRWFEHYLKGAGGEPPPYRLDYGIEEKQKEKEKETAEKDDSGEEAKK